MRAIYLLSEQAETPTPPFRTGDVGTVNVDPSGRLELRVGVSLSANTVHALLGHGVVDALNELSIEGRIGDGREVLIPPSSLDDTRRIFYEADRRTYGGSFEFVVERRTSPELVEYRVRIENREYQASLARLQFLVTQAGHDGLAVWIRI